jgi:hypothetical protein
LEYWRDDTDKGNRNIQNNPISVANYATEIPHGITCDRSRNLVVRDLPLAAKTWCVLEVY